MDLGCRGVAAMTPYECIVTLSAMRGRNRASWTAAYAEWQRLVRTVSRGAVTPTGGKPFFISDVLRDEVVEEVQAALASRATEIMQVVIDRVGAPMPTEDADAVLAPHGSATLGDADRIVVSYVRTSLGNRAVSELRKGWRRAEDELRHAATATPAEGHDDETLEAKEADAALVRAKDALATAMARVIDAAAPRYGEAYREQCDDLKALADGSVSMEAIVLRALSREDSVVDTDAAVHIASIQSVVETLSPSADADEVRERAEARDARFLAEHVTRNRQRLVDLQRAAGAPAEAVDALLAAVAAFEAFSRDRWRSPAGNRAAERIYKAHERMRTALAAALRELCDQGQLEPDDAAIAARIIAELFTRRQKRVGRASLGMRGTHGK